MVAGERTEVEFPACLEAEEEQDAESLEDS
jgi:hypothetical protein